jgi:L-threonylcarbamoyladenylate synthase
MFSEEYIQQIQDGFPVVYPTSTLPALGVRPQKIGLDRLFKLKERDDLKIVSIAVANTEQMKQFVQIPDYLGNFLDLFPTGSITCILNSINKFDSRIGGESIAIRIVGHPIARDLLLKVGPLTATSANISGLETLYSCDDAAKALGLSKNNSLDVTCKGGKPSTLIRCPVFLSSSGVHKPEIVREGIVSNDEVMSKWKLLI